MSVTATNPSGRGGGTVDEDDDVVVELLEEDIDVEELDVDDDKL